MKKIMILLLSLAVLFSFAACDNSSDTPADDETTTGGVTTEIANDAADAATKAINDSTNGFAAVVTAGDVAAKVGTSLDEITTLTITKNVGTPAIGLKQNTQTVVLTGVNTSAKDDDGTNTKPYDVTFDTFAYTYTAYGYDANGEVIEHVAKINGYLAETLSATVQVDSKKLVSKYTLVGTPTYVLAATDPISFTVDGVAYDAETFSDAISVASIKSYADYQKGEEDTVKARIDEYMALFTAAALKDKITTWLVPATAPASNWKAEYNPANGGSAVFSFTPSVETSIVGATSAEELRLATNTPITITLKAAESPNPAASGFTAVSYAIDGVLTAYDAETEEPLFKTIDINVSGTIANDASNKVDVAVGVSTDVVGSVTVTGTPALTATSGSAAVTAEVKPELVPTTADGVTTVALTTGPVSVTYPKATV